MGTQIIQLSSGTNYNNGQSGSSHVVGQYTENGQLIVRTEQYSFTTGDKPVVSLQLDSRVAGKASGSGTGTINWNYSIDPIEHRQSTSGGYVAAVNNAPTTLQFSPALAPNTTYYLTYFPVVTSGNLTYYTYSNSFNMTATTVDYTKCSSPQNLRINGQSSTIVTPISSVLSWTASAPGIGVQISSYSVEYQIGGISSIISSTTNQVQISLSGASRGAQVRYRVKAIANVSGFDSDWSNWSSYSTINNLPLAPVVNVNRTLVPSGGGSVQFTFTPGTDSDGSQPLSVYYSIDNSSTKILCTSPLTINISAAATYKFWTYDGLEYSSNSTNKSISINILPVAILTTASYEAGYLIGGENTYNGYTYHYQVTPTVSLSKSSGNLQVWAELYTQESHLSSEPDYDYLIGTYPIATGTFTRTFNLFEVIRATRGQIANSDPVFWKLRFAYNDGIEDAAEIYLANGATYCIAGMQTPTIYNNHSNTSIMPANHIWNKVRFYMKHDTSVVSATAEATYAGNTITTTDVKITVDNNNYVNYDVTFGENIFGSGQSGIIVTLTLATSNNNYILRYASNSYTECVTPITSIGANGYGIEVIKPFTSTGTFEITIANPFPNGGATNYDCSNASVKLLLERGASSYLLHDLNWRQDGDSYKATYNQSDVYPFTHALGIADYSGVYSYNVYVIIDNNFGRRYRSTSGNTSKFDFDESIQSIEILTVKYQNPTTSQYIPLGTGKIQQNMELRFEFQYKYYTKRDYTIDLLANGLSYQTFLITPSSGSTTRSLTSATISIDAAALPEIQNDSWSWEIKEAAGTAEDSISTKAYIQRDPQITFISASIDNNDKKKLKVSYSKAISEPGGSVVYSVTDGTNDYAIPASNVIEKSTAWTSSNLRIKAVSTSSTSQLLSNTFTYFSSNYISVYAETPTVAYRHNNLGINTAAPASDTIIDIYPGQNRQIVRIHGVASDGYLEVSHSSLIWHSSNSEISPKTIDFAAGKLIGFTLG